MRRNTLLLGFVCLAFLLSACNPTTTGRAKGRTYSAIDRGPYWRYWDRYPPIPPVVVLPPDSIVPPEPGLPIEPPIVPELPIEPGPDFGGGFGGDFGDFADIF